MKTLIISVFTMLFILSSFSSCAEDGEMGVGHVGEGIDPPREMVRSSKADSISHNIIITDSIDTTIITND